MKLLKDSLIYLIGELAAKALPFLLLPYLTRKFGAAGFGDLSYWQTLFSLLIIVLSLAKMVRSRAIFMCTASAICPA